MSNAIIDDGDNWKVPEPSADRGHVARVHLLQAGFAREILAIPLDVTPRSRAIRIGKAKERVSRFYSWMCEKYVFSTGTSVRITDDRAMGLWMTAYCEAVRTVQAALDAGEDLARFLLGDEDAVA